MDNIITHHILDLQKHVFPVLKKHDRGPRWLGGEINGEAIMTNDGYISICNTNHLFVRGSQELAEFLAEHIQPFGSKVVIQFYPEDVLPGPKPSTARQIFNTMFK